MCHALALCTLIAGPTLAQATRPLILDDVLALEEVGTVQVSPDGRFVIFEQIPGSSSRKDFGLSSGKYEARVMVYDSKTMAKAQRLRVDSGVLGEWLGPMSPDGRRVLLYWREGSATKVGFYSFSDGRISSCAFRPAVDFGLSDPIWISSGELLQASSTDERPPLAVGFLKDSARRLAASWERAWAGQEPTADVVSATGSAAVEKTTTALLRVDAETCETKALATGRFLGLALSPTKEYVVAARREGLLPQGTNIQRAAHEGVWRYVPYLLSLKSSAAPVLLCTECDVLPSSLQWHASGKSLLYFAREPTRSWETGLFRLYRPDSGESIVYEHTGLDLVSQREHGHLAVPELAVPLRTGIAVAARPQQARDASPKFSDRAVGIGDQGRIDWYLLESNRSPQNLTRALNGVSATPIALRADGLVLSADGGIYRTAPKLRKIVTLGESRLAVDFHNDTVDARTLYSSSIAAVTSEEGEALRTFTDTGTPIAQLRAPSGSWTLAALAADGRAAVFRSMFPVGRLAFVRGTGSPTMIWEFNSHLAAIAPAREIQVSYRLADGTDARSCALLPPGPGLQKSAPIIVHVYPGQGRCWHLYRDGVSYFYEPELLASMGYIVLFPFAPPEKLRSAAGPLSNWNEMVTPALDSLASAGYGDATLVGAFGMSYGSVSTLALLTQSSRIRAAVASNGLANFTSHYGTLGLARRVMPDDLFAAGQSSQYQSRGSYLWMGSYPWEKPVDYIEASPISAVDKIHTPLLLLHSDLDWNYPMEEFDQVYVSLFRLGREVEYVRYWGEGHGLTSPANVRDMWMRVETWFREHLVPAGNAPH